MGSNLSIKTLFLVPIGSENDLRNNVLRRKSSIIKVFLNAKFVYFGGDERLFSHLHSLIGKFKNSSLSPFLTLLLFCYLISYFLVVLFSVCNVGEKEEP